MIDSMSVELPISDDSKVIQKHRTIGDLRKTYPKLVFLKYIFRDPKDNKLKGANPSDDLPLVARSYITFRGTFNPIIRFTKDATEKFKDSR